MSKDIRGYLMLSTAVCFIDTNGKDKLKRITLESIPCSYSECEAIKDAFIEKNIRHMKSHEIDAEFRFREFI